MEPNDPQDQPDLPQDEEFNAPIEDTAVAVASPPYNGNGHSPPPVKLPDDGRKINVSYVGPGAAQRAASDLMGRVNSRPAYARETERTKTDREWLAAFYIKPDAVDYQLCIHRVLPSVNRDGEAIPTGFNSQHFVPIMFYDDLVATITEVWGGGQYRVSVADLQGRSAQNVDRCVRVDIPTSLHPAKRTKGEQVEPVAKPGLGAIQSIQDEEAKKRKAAMDELVDNERREAKEFEIQHARMQRELKMEEAKLRMEQTRRSFNTNPNEKSAEIALLEKRLEGDKAERLERERKAEEERKEAQRRADDERKERDRKYDEDRKEAERRHAETIKTMMDQMARMSEKITEVSNRPPPPKEDSMEKMLAVVGPIVAAIINKPAALLPDNKDLIIELNKANAKTGEAVIQLTTAMLQAPKADPNAGPMALMMKMMENDKTGKDNLMGNLITAIVSNKSELTPDVMMQLIGMGEKRADKIIEMTRDFNQHGEGEDGYDPALGMLGNAGKAIFNGLKSLLESAASNPAVQELMMKFVGSRTPNEQQLAQVAWQMEHGGRAIPMQMQPPQLRYQPVDQSHQPGPNPYAQPQGPHVQPQRRGPAPLPGARPAQQAVNPAQQQSAVANELEGNASGLPGNGDPEQGPPPTPEELAMQELRNAVTATIEIAIGEVKNKPAKRTWPEDATDHWPQSFIQQIVANPSRDERGRLIGRACWEDTIQQFMQLLQQDREEVDRWWRELDRFAEMNIGKVTLPGHAHPIQPVTPQVPPQQPVTIITPDPPVNR